MELNKNIIHFMEKQGFVIVSTLDPNGQIHCAAKGIVGIEKSGKIYVIDLYQHRTYQNLQRNPIVSITAVDEHDFIGFTLQGMAKIVPREQIEEHIMTRWEEKIVNRISKRVVTGVQSKKKSKAHFEAHLPHHPLYLIEIEVQHIIDLSPPGIIKKVA
jgi:uncharacterized pyridoxamine 5'-phosphate oxidase family protein